MVAIIELPGIGAALCVIFYIQIQPQFISSGPFLEFPSTVSGRYAGPNPAKRSFRAVRRHRARFDVSFSQ